MRARGRAEKQNDIEKHGCQSIPISDVQPVTTEPRASMLARVYEKRCCRLAGVIIMGNEATMLLCGAVNTMRNEKLGFRI